MSKTFKRFIAYLIDMVVVMLVVQSLTGIPQLNPQLDKYSKYYNDYLNLTTDYYKFKNNLIEDYKDDLLTTKEYKKIIKENPSYEQELTKYFNDNKLSNKDYNKLIKEIDKSYRDEALKLSYKIDKNSILYFIVYLVAVILYFVGFNKYTGGQTLGKKLMRLKIVNSKDEKKEVSVLQYLLRTIILYRPIYYAIRLIGVSTLNINVYYEVVNVFNTIQSYLMLATILLVILRVNGRGLHDLLASTRVLMYDKNGAEVYDKLDLLVKEMKQDKVNSK